MEALYPHGDVLHPMAMTPRKSGLDWCGTQDSDVMCGRGNQHGAAVMLPHLQNRATLAVISLEVLGLCSKKLQKPHRSFSTY